MSLDVYLKTDKEPTQYRAIVDRIFIREDGQNREITREEWDERFPGREPVVFSPIDGHLDDYVFTSNITHNLGAMAREAGLYEPLWRPEEIGITHASQLIDPLREGLTHLLAEPDRMQEFNPENGWGTYEGLIRFTAGYLAACEQWPDAVIEVSR